MSPLEELFGEVISTYTRAQAIEDGFLVDVSTVALDAGIRFPTAMTRTVWDRYVEVPEKLKGIQDVQGRLWDILWMLRSSISRGQGGSVIFFGVHVRNDRRRGTPPLVTLKAICGPGDDAKPVITISLPEED